MGKSWVAQDDWGLEPEARWQLEPIRWSGDLEPLSGPLPTIEAGGEGEGALRDSPKSF